MDPNTLNAIQGAAGAGGSIDPCVAIAHYDSPYISVYPWETGTGFGTKFANPSTLPNIVKAVAFSPDGANIAVVGAYSPYVYVYPWSSDGFGTKYSDPSTLPAGSSMSVAFSPDGANLAVGHQTAPRITVYPWSSSGFGTKYTDPSSALAGTGQGVAWSPDGADIAVAHYTSPFITVYPWSSGFGTKYADPSSLPGSYGMSVAFSPDGTDIALGHGNGTNPTCYMTSYPWSSSGFGTKYMYPSINYGYAPAGTVTGIKFSPDGNDLAASMDSTPFIRVWPWPLTGYGAPYSNPGTLPANHCLDVAFSPDGADIAVVHYNLSGHRISAYPWYSGSGYGTKYANPSSQLPGQGNGVAFFGPAS